MNKETALSIISELEKLYPAAECALKYEGEPWKLLIMARLSAQCTDARVNIVSEKLFSHYPTVNSMAESNINELEEIVKPCGLYRVKAADIKNECIMLLNEFNGEVPDDMESLLKLPGVGRKIANLILGDIFNKPAVVTDTHCIRLAGRLGFCNSDEKNPLRVERILSDIIPPEKQSDFCHRLVFFGREFCTARSPKCGECPLFSLCAYEDRL